MSPTDTDVTSPQDVRRYRVNGVLGRGGFGTRPGTSSRGSERGADPRASPGSEHRQRRPTHPARPVRAEAPITPEWRRFPWSPRRPRAASACDLPAAHEEPAVPRDPLSSTRLARRRRRHGGCIRSRRSPRGGPHEQLDRSGLAPRTRRHRGLGCARHRPRLRRSGRPGVGRPRRLISGVAPRADPPPPAALKFRI